ncbi:Protein kinase alk2, partial [Entomortierella beljakovae]
FKETLRIKPAIPRNIRFCIKEDILPDGTKIYPGEVVGWSSYVMGRTESIWGPDAKQFIPSRWLNFQKRPTLAMFNSFHLGPRMCLGHKFAVTEASTIVSMMLQKFEFELEEPERVAKYLVSITYPMAGGLRVKVKRRSRAAVAV